MVNSIVFGLLLSMATIAIHALGTSWWILRLRAFMTTRPATAHKFSRHLRVLCSTAVAFLTLHILEIVMWALFYLMVVNDDSLSTFEEAVYFSTVTFASLGYGDVVIEGHWRLLSAIEAMTGLLVFGWSSALLFTVVQRIFESMTPPE